MVAVVVVVVVAVVLAGAAMAGVAWVRRAGTAGRAAAEAAAGGEPVVLQADANSFGLASAGMAQVRGNGTLVLTGQALVFAQWVPARTVRIPRSAITEVATPRSHLGKSRGVRLLRVAWRTDGGTEDAIGLQVRDLDGWVTALGGTTG